MGILMAWMSENAVMLVTALRRTMLMLVWYNREF